MTTVRRDSRARQERMLALLADGKFHSGEQIAQRLRVSRSAIWKMVRVLRAIDIDVQSVPRQGYKLARPVDLLSTAAIVNSLSADVQQRLEKCDVLLEIDSTNRYLTAQAAPAQEHARVCLAEVQTAGRGRRGRTWLAPFGSGLCLSVAWKFSESPPAISSLSLAVGVAVLRTLQSCGADDVTLKWPNDLMWRGRKLAGVLIDVRGETAGPTDVIIGIGMNVRMPAAARIMLAEQHAALVADLHEILGSGTPDRNVLAAGIIEHLIEALREFAVTGLTSFIAEWRESDALKGAPVRVLSGTEVFLGIARGVAVDGALLVEVDGELRRFVSADVSLRPVRT